MSAEPPEILSPERELALAHTPVGMRDKMAVALWLDQRLARIVSQTTEPMLGQMRLAWWRDMLARPLGERPTGDVVLDGISRLWQDEEAPLRACIDGWERMLDEPPLSGEAALELAAGRASAVVAVAGLRAEAGANAVVAAKRWALVDAALNIEAEAERAMFLDLAGGLAEAGGLPRSLRGLAVLDALARRSLKRGGRPLMEGRGAALVAARAAIFGR